MTTPSAFAILPPRAIDGDGEGNARLASRLAVEQQVARDRTRERANRAAGEKARGRAAQFSPDGHGAKH